MKKKKFKCEDQTWQKFKKNCRRRGSSADQELRKFIAKFNEAHSQQVDLDQTNIDSQIRESLGVQDEIKEKKEAFEYLIKTQ